MFGWFKKKEPEVKVGDIIICIDDRDWNNVNQSLQLVFKKSYKVQDITRCKCGNAYDIGCRFTDKNAHTRCFAENILFVGAGIHWAGHFRFRKATPEEESEHYRAQTEEIQSQIESLVANEEYNKAAELQKLLEK